ncbi:MAG: tetratricopeptide repeat protein [Planctomycetota bacterium]
MGRGRSIRVPVFPNPSPALYLTLLSLAVALVVGVGSWFLGAGWFFAGLLGLVAFVATWIIGARRIGRRLEPTLQQARRQIEAGLVKPAIASMRSVLPMARWIPLLGGQIHAQIGFLEHQTGDQDAAVASLSRAGRRSGDAKLLLACIQFRDGKKDEALAELEECTRFNRKHVLSHNVYAWLLNREGKRAEAIEVLNRLLKKENDAKSTANRLRLQNGQKMDMAQFGMMWYALGFERPPASMGQMRTAPKGFRQPPKRKRG